MRPWRDIPRRGYVTRPTPLEELTRFSKRIGVRVRMKRDDLLPLGEYRIRKLDYLIEEAVQAGADTLITASTNQCCHNSMTALLAAREGMACRMIMESWGDTRYRYETAANHAMMELCGPEETAVVTGKSREDMERSVRSQCRELTDFLETGTVPDGTVRCVEGFSGGGYGRPSREQVLWMKALAGAEGILTDPVYSGKALYGLCGLAARGEYQGPGGLVFLHTGGLQLFYDFSSLADMEA